MGHRTRIERQVRALSVGTVAAAASDNHRSPGPQSNRVDQLRKRLGLVIGKVAVANYRLAFTKMDYD